MVLSAALDNGYIFLSLIAILTSVVGAVYYLGIIRDMFFYSPEHSINPDIVNSSLVVAIPEYVGIAEQKIMSQKQARRSMYEKLKCPKKFMEELLARPVKVELSF